MKRRGFLKSCCAAIGGLLGMSVKSEGITPQQVSIRPLPGMSSAEMYRQLDKLDNVSHARQVVMSKQLRDALSETLCRVKVMGDTPDQYMGVPVTVSPFLPVNGTKGDIHAVLLGNRDFDFALDYALQANKDCKWSRIGGQWSSLT